MNVKDFSYLLKHPNEGLSLELSKQLEGIIEEYPYFQTARALHLKSLRDNHSFKYNNALKVTAAHTTDRDVLFDFITSDEFLQNRIADVISDRSGTLAQAENPEKETPVNTNPVNLIEDSEDKPLPRTLKDADHILDPDLFESKNTTSDKEAATDGMATHGSGLQLGEPLPFTRKEKHSFAEWLQLTSLKPLDKEPAVREILEPDPDMDDANLKRKKFLRIDKFLEDNPKIVPIEDPSPEINIKDSLTFDKNELMTETLAKVYLEQKKYKKAIQAYKILSLKYPEKSGFFADRIKAVEKLKKENI